MNLIDIIVLAVILIMGFIGYKRGLIKTAIGLCSFFIAIAVSLMFYKPLAIILTEKTQIDEWIVENLEKKAQDSPEKLPEETEPEVEEEELNVQNALEKLPGAILEKIDLSSAKAAIVHEMAVKAAELIMNLLSLISIYLVIKITLFIAELLLSGLMKLPVLKQVNEILGMCLGAVMGFIDIYIAFAIITFVSSITNIAFIVDPIKASAIAKYMFENNLIIKLLF